MGAPSGVLSPIRGADRHETTQEVGIALELSSAPARPVPAERCAGRNRAPTVVGGRIHQRQTVSGVQGANQGPPLRQSTERPAQDSLARRRALAGRPRAHGPGFCPGRRRDRPAHRPCPRPYCCHRLELPSSVPTAPPRESQDPLPLQTRAMQAGRATTDETVRIPFLHTTPHWPGHSSRFVAPPARPPPAGPPYPARSHRASLSAAAGRRRACRRPPRLPGPAAEHLDHPPAGATLTGHVSRLAPPPLWPAWPTVLADLVVHGGICRRHLVDNAVGLLEWHCTVLELHESLVSATSSGFLPHSGHRPPDRSTGRQNCAHPTQ